MSRARVGLATCRELPDLDPPERLVIPPLEALDIEVSTPVWDDPDVDWAALDLVVVRSTWDYPGRRDELVAWAHRVEATTVLCNPAEVIGWNTDKRYLDDLAAVGIPIVPTTWVVPGRDEGADLARLLPATGEFVVKPTESAGSRDTARYRGTDDVEAAVTHLARLLDAGRAAMVQPYLDSVDDVGETALLHLDGTFSHAIRKGPLLRVGGDGPDGLFAPEDITPRTPSPREHEVAAAVMAELDRRHGSLLYARVDLLATDDGPVVLEVELTEPSLFIETDAVLPERLARAILGRLR